MTLQTAEKIIGEKIVTHFWAKPIPPREFDWCAYRDNDEPDDDGHMLQGWGRTEQDAIDDLIEQLRDHDDDGKIEGSEAWSKANGKFGVGA